MPPETPIPPPYTPEQLPALVEELQEKVKRVQKEAIETGNTSELDALTVELKQKVQELQELYGTTDTIAVKTKVKYGEATRATEKEKTIEFNFEKQLQRWTDFYTRHGISTDNFEDQMTQVWERNEVKITEAIQQEGYDEILLIPPISSLSDLHANMTEGYNPTYLDDNFKKGGSFEGAITENQDKPQIVLVHKENAENIYNNPNAPTIALETLTKSIDWLTTNHREGLSLIQYLIYQRMYYEETTNHLDKDGWTWTPKTKVTVGGFSRFVNSDWYPDDGQLFVNAGGSDRANGNLCSRPSRSFM